MDFDMGKYGFFVWGAYGLSALAIGLLIYISLKAHHQFQKQVQALNALKTHGNEQ